MNPIEAAHKVANTNFKAIQAACVAIQVIFETAKNDLEAVIPISALEVTNFNATQAACFAIQAIFKAVIPISVLEAANTNFKATQAACFAIQAIFKAVAVDFEAANMTLNAAYKAANAKRQVALEAANEANKNSYDAYEKARTKHVDAIKAAKTKCKLAEKSTAKFKFICFFIVFFKPTYFEAAYFNSIDEEIAADATWEAAKATFKADWKKTKANWEAADSAYNTEWETAEAKVDAVYETLYETMREVNAMYEIICEASRKTQETLRKAFCKVEESISII
jgi:hypothetical protein